MYLRAVFLTFLISLVAQSYAVAQCSISLTQSSIKHPSCGGSDGYFVIDVEGITEPYQFVLTKLVNGSPVIQTQGTQLAGSPTFVGLSEGTFKLSVSKDGCSNEIEVTLTQETLIMTQSAIKHPSCGGSDGYFVIDVEGITEPYQFVLTKLVNGSPVIQTQGTQLAGNPTFVGLSEGTYKLAISKGGTCSGEIEVTLTQEALTMAPGSIQNPSCGGSDGYFVIDVEGITEPYQFVLTKLVNGSHVIQTQGTQLAGNPTFVGLSEGTYKLAISKGGTCSGEITIHLYCELIGKEGCGSGYWKNNLGAWSMINYVPGQTLESVFNIPDQYGLDNMTLLESLNTTSGTNIVAVATNLLRVATTALLNISHNEVDYPITTQQLISSVNSALASNNKNTMSQLAGTLDKYNSKNCPLKAQMIPQVRETAPEDLSVVVSTLQVKAYPNPSRSVFNVYIDTRSSEPVTVSVVDLLGRVIEERSQVRAQQTISFGSSYHPGVYLLQVTQGNERKQVKLVKLQ